MSLDSDFDDMVKICEFYASSADDVKVDLENYHITMGEYGVDPVIGEGGDHLAYYLIEEPDGTSLFVNDLDDYFQDQFSDCLEERF